MSHYSSAGETRSASHTRGLDSLSAMVASPPLDGMHIGTKPLKILHVLDHSAPLQSGYVFRSQNIFREQLKRGWHPVALTSPKHEASSQEPWQESQDIADVRYYRTQQTPRSSLSRFGELPLMRALAARLREVVELEKPDLLHAHSPVLNVIPALWVGRKMGIPVLYEIRAFWEDALADQGKFAEGSLRYRIIKEAESLVCRFTHGTFVLCQGIQTDLHKRGIPQERLTPVRNGVDAESLAPCSPDEKYRRIWQLSNKRVIGFIGSFYRYEGLDLLVEAFARLAQPYPDLVLLLVGGGEVETELRAQVARLKLEERVLMPGRVAHTRIAGVYSLMDLLVYPRYSVRLTELVTPLKPLEAMAMRKAIIASDIGGHRELLRDSETALLFKAGDASAMAQTISRLLEDGSLRERLARQARDFVLEERSWKKTTAAYEPIYARALQHASS
jgi:PEP-CTERM/exosortase A-associated glycosyltransferase